MSSATIRTAWNTGVFQHATITAITTKIYQYDVTAAVRSKPEAELFYYNQKVNFFKQTVVRQARNNSLRGNNSLATRYEYDIEVSYYLERDFAATAANYNLAIDRIETMDDLVRTQLGKTWSSTVSHWEVSGILSPQLIQLDGRDVWQAGYSYTATEMIA